MYLTKKQELDLKKITELLATIRPGDKVRVVNCWEARFLTDKVFTVESEPRKIGARWSVKLNEHGWYDLGCIQKIKR